MSDIKKNVEKTTKNTIDNKIMENWPREKMRDVCLKVKEK